MHKYQTHLDEAAHTARLIYRREHERALSRREMARSRSKKETRHAEHDEVGVLRKISRVSIKALLGLGILMGGSYGGLKITKPELAMRGENFARTQISRVVRHAPALRPPLEFASEITTRLLDFPLLKVRTDRTVHGGTIPLATPAEISQYPEYAQLSTTTIELNRAISRFGALDERQLATWADELTRLTKNPQTAVGIPIRALETLANAQTSLQTLALDSTARGDGATWETYHQAAQTYLDVAAAYRDIFRHHKETKEMSGFGKGVRYRLQSGETNAADIVERFGYVGDERDTAAKALLAANNLKANQIRADRPIDVTSILGESAADVPDELRAKYADGYLNTLTINRGRTGVHVLFGQFIFDPLRGSDIAVCAADMDAKDRRNFESPTISYDPRYLGQPNAYQTLSTMLRNGASELPSGEPTVLLQDLDAWSETDLSSIYAPTVSTRVTIKYSLAEYKRSGLPAGYRLSQQKGANGYIYVDTDIPTRTAKARTGQIEDRIAYLNGHWWRIGIDLTTLAPKLNEYYDAARMPDAKGGYVFLSYPNSNDLYKIILAAQDTNYDGSYGSHYAANHGVQTLTYTSEELRYRLAKDTFTAIDALRGIYPSGWENPQNIIDREHIFSQAKLTITKANGETIKTTLLEIYNQTAPKDFTIPLAPGDQLSMNDLILEDELNGAGRLLPASIMFAEGKSHGVRFVPNFVPERVVGKIPEQYRQPAIPRAAVAFSKIDGVHIASIDYPERLTATPQPISFKAIGISGGTFDAAKREKIFTYWNTHIAARDPQLPSYDFRLSLEQNEIFYYPSGDGLVFKYFEKTFDGPAGVWERWVRSGIYRESDKDRVEYFLKRYGIDVDGMWLNTKPLPIFAFDRPAELSQPRQLATFADIRSKGGRFANLDAASITAAQTVTNSPTEQAALISHQSLETGSGNVNAALKEVAHTLGVATSSAGKLQTNVETATKEIIILASQPIRSSDPAYVVSLKQAWQRDPFIASLRPTPQTNVPKAQRGKTMIEKIRDNEITAANNADYRRLTQHVYDTLIADQTGDGQFSFLAGRLLRATHYRTVDVIARSLLGDAYYTARTPEWERNRNILADSLYTGEHGHLIRGQHYLIRSLLGRDTSQLSDTIDDTFKKELEEVLFVKHQSTLQKLGLIITPDTINAALTGMENGKRVYSSNIGRIFGFSELFAHDAGEEATHPLRALAQLWSATHGGELAPLFMGKDVEKYRYVRGDGKDNVAPRGVNVWRDIDTTLTRAVPNASAAFQQTWVPTNITYGVN